jgi:hypothetical protein
MPYIKCSNRANPAYDPSLIPPQRLQAMLTRLHQHWVNHGGFCNECHGTDCSVIKSELWDCAHWSYEPNIIDAAWFLAALTAYHAEYGHHLGQSVD